MAKNTSNWDGTSYELVKVPASRKGRAAIDWNMGNLQGIPIDPNSGVYAKQWDSRVTALHAGSLNPRLRTLGFKMIVRSVSSFKGIAVPNQFIDTEHNNMVPMLINYGSEAAVPFSKRTRKATEV